ncbi:hypothetical protein GN956_G17042 [Arapaima gigas]
MTLPPLLTTGRHQTCPNLSHRLPTQLPISPTFSGCSDVHVTAPARHSSRRSARRASRMSHCCVQIRAHFAATVPKGLFSH